MGHCPPYVAVITLSVLTAHHWRTIRVKMLQSGISLPMDLANMHLALDLTEMAILESIANEGAKDSDFKRSQFLDKLYSPMVDAKLNGNNYVAQPQGFSQEEVEASFDAFAAVAL